MTVICGAPTRWRSVPAFCGQANYGYDGASRLASVSDGNGNSAAYSYVANSPLVGHIMFKRSSTTEMTTTNQYDYLNRLTSVSSTGGASGAVPVSFNYAYNSANQRTRSTLVDNSYWAYAYDALGQVTSGHKHWYDNSVAAGQQFDYAFDTIGNRQTTWEGGDASGANQRQANYTNNILNQITSRDAPGYIEVQGASIATNTVTVNGATAYRKWEYFRDELAVTNTSSPVWQNITVTNTSQFGASGYAYVPETPENYTYDQDGNLASDGRWTYTWDAENRLVWQTSFAGAPTGSKYQLNYTYDYQCRRVQKTVWTNNGSGYIASYTNRFLYDGWNVVAISDGYNNLLYTFTWGKDLSGTMQGAGGVGGLISMTVNSGSNAGTYFYCYDGNGNVASLVSASTGAIAAQYDYGPFGEVIRATGPMAKLNPFLFSTKYYDWETGLYYYGYRYYNPSTGTWPSRDPIGELGGKNLYGFVKNNPVSNADKFGFLPFCNGCTKHNEVIPLKVEWEIGTPDKTPGQIEGLQQALRGVENLGKADTILKLLDGNASILFPPPDLTQNTINDVLQFLEVNLFGRIKYKVCANLGPRFVFFGSDQWDWITETEGWDPSDKNTYHSGGDAVQDVSRFLETMEVAIKSKYPDSP